MTYVFKDEFAGAAGSAPNPKLWTYQTDKTDGEVQAYTSSRENSYLDGQGHLVIQAGRSGGKITSARLVTRGLAVFDTGTFTARVKLDATPGTWPAFWLLGQDSQFWPACGEVDIFEWYGNGSWGPTTTVHTGSNAPGTPGQDGDDHSVDIVINKPAAWWTEWHNWQIKLTDDPRYPNEGIQRLAFFVDGVRYYGVSSGPGLPDWPFARGNPLYILLNLAVGGAGGGTVPANFAGSKMLVDYVHVWQD